MINFSRINHLKNYIKYLFIHFFPVSGGIYYNKGITMRVEAQGGQIFKTTFFLKYSGVE